MPTSCYRGQLQQAGRIGESFWSTNRARLAIGVARVCSESSALSYLILQLIKSAGLHDLSQAKLSIPASLALIETDCSSAKIDH